jgi:hypothetical protein
MKILWHGHAGRLLCRRRWLLRTEMWECLVVVWRSLKVGWVQISPGTLEFAAPLPFYLVLKVSSLPHVFRNYHRQIFPFLLLSTQSSSVGNGLRSLRRRCFARFLVAYGIINTPHHGPRGGVFCLHGRFLIVQCSNLTEQRRLQLGSGMVNDGQVALSCAISPSLIPFPPLTPKINTSSCSIKR